MEESIRFIAYNMMFGMYGREGLLNLLGHFSIHGLKSLFLTKVFSRFNKKTAELLCKKNADIICINEVIGFRKEQLINEFKLKGYNYFYWGQSKHHKSPLDIGTLILTKEKAEKLDFKLTNVNKPGGGGGSYTIFIKEHNLVVLAVHLALRKRLLDKQIIEIANFINKQNKSNKKVVLLGDFNLSESELKSFKNFKELNLKSSTNEKTCPFVLELNPFKFKCVDNIFFNKNIKLIKSQTFNGYSDHKGVLADLKL